MQTHFIRGLATSAKIGQETWQKAIDQKILIDLEWQNNQRNIDSTAHSASSNITSDSTYSLIISKINELISSKQWDSLGTLIKELEQFLQNEIHLTKFKLTITAPHLLSNTQAIGASINRLE